MTRYVSIDLSQLPPPAVIKTLSFDQIKLEMVRDLIARDPSFTALLESDPIIKAIEVFGYRELLIRQQINDSARAVLLPLAIGTDLDNLASFFGTKRMVEEINNQTVTESDDRLRMRVQLALEALSCAGPVGAYLYHTLSVSLRVADASAFMTSPGTVQVSVYTTDNGGIPDDSLLTAIRLRLNADEIRPLTDVVVVRPAIIVHYNVAADVRLYPGPDSATAQSAISSAVRSYTARVAKLGSSVTVSDLYGAITQYGVQGSTITSPASDIALNDGEIGVCDSVSITISPTRVQ